MSAGIPFRFTAIPNQAWFLAIKRPAFSSTVRSHINEIRKVERLDGHHLKANKADGEGIVQRVGKLTQI